MDHNKEKKLKKEKLVQSETLNAKSNTYHFFVLFKKGRCHSMVYFFPSIVT